MGKLEAAKKHRSTPLTIWSEVERDRLPKQSCWTLNGSRGMGSSTRKETGITTRVNPCRCSIALHLLPRLLGPRRWACLMGTLTGTMAGPTLATMARAEKCGMSMGAGPMLQSSPSMVEAGSMLVVWWWRKWWKRRVSTRCITSTAIGAAMASAWDLHPATAGSGWMGTRKLGGCRRGSEENSRHERPGTKNNLLCTLKG